MNKPTANKLHSQVELPDSDIGVRPPFRLDREEQRQFVRLEISAPVSVIRVKDTVGNFWPTGEDAVVDGTVLNISAGGVLVEITPPLNTGDIVAMRFTLQGAETVDHVLGAVKRVEPAPEGCLAGIQFVDRDYLCDKLTHGELELLAEHFDTFTRKVQDVLQKYVYRIRTAPKGY
ncbi:MAG: PilZ domain-containing protein [Candidatus Zixiibacteriota bacterium]